MTSKKTTKNEDNIIYFHREETNDRDASKSYTVEKMVRHSDAGVFFKFFENKDGKTRKITVKADKPKLGEYTLSIKEGSNDAKNSTHDKKGLMAVLKERKELDFMLAYFNKEKSLARPVKKTSKKASKKSKSSKK